MECLWKIKRKGRKEKKEGGRRGRPRNKSSKKQGTKKKNLLEPFA